MNQGLVGYILQKISNITNLTIAENHTVSNQPVTSNAVAIFGEMYFNCHQGQLTVGSGNGLFRP